MDDLGKDIERGGADAAEEFSLDDILKEFSDENLIVPAADAERPAAATPIDFHDEGKVATAVISSEKEADEPEPDDEPEPEAEPTAPHGQEPPKTKEKSDYDIVNSYKPVDTRPLDELLKEVDFDFVTDKQATPTEYAAVDSTDGQPEDGDAEYAAEEMPEDVRDAREMSTEPERPFGEKVAAPFVALMAMISIKLQQRKSSSKAAPAQEAEDLGPEMDPDKASKYYGAHINGLRLRTRLAGVLCLILMYISFGLPVFGRLNNVVVCALMCLVLELAVVVICLDVFTAGIMDIVRKKPGAGSLIAVSCILSALDAVVIAATGNKSIGLPFCAVSALSIACALWGSLLQCKGNRISLRALALSKDPLTVTSEAGVAEGELTLLKTRSTTDNFVRRTEEMGPDEEVYSTLAPWLMGAALILSLLAAAFSRNFGSIMHILTAIFMPAAPLSALLAFPLPYSVVSRHIFHSGSAIAGWSGLYDAGGSRHIIVTDRDLFPKDTVSISSIRILEGMSSEKVISYAGSVICASGSGLAPVFTELMKKNHCAMEHMDEFCCHEGGGLTAMINGEEVLCGSSGFMHLMGIRLPQKLTSKTSVFVSINGMISAIFTINYTPVVTVQKALACLLHSRYTPIFAVRDFNITPEMLRHKFRLPTDGFDFPSFAKRYEVSSTQRSGEAKIAGIISREGLSALVEFSERSHRLYNTVRLSVLLSVLCSIIGMILMFFLCLTGAFDSVSVQNMLLYMLIWLLPEAVMVFGLSR